MYSTNSLFSYREPGLWRSLPCWCHFYVNTTKVWQGNEGEFLNNSRIQNKNKQANNIREAAAYRTEGSQPNTVGDKNLFEISVQNKKKVSTHSMNQPAHPRVPRQLYIGHYWFMESHWRCVSTHFSGHLGTLEHHLKSLPNASIT